MIVVGQRLEELWCRGRAVRHPLLLVDQVEVLDRGCPLLEVVVLQLHLRRAELVHVAPQQRRGQSLSPHAPLRRVRQEHTIGAGLGQGEPPLLPGMALRQEADLVTIHCSALRSTTAANCRLD